MTDDEIIEEAKKIMQAKQEKEEKSKKALRNKKRKGLFMKCIIVFMFIYLTVFTYKVLDCFVKTGSEPSTLIGAVFLFCGWESGCLSKIKINKKKDGETNV